MVTAIVLIKSETNRIPDLAQKIANGNQADDTFVILSGRSHDKTCSVRDTRANRR